MTIISAHDRGVKCAYLEEGRCWFCCTNCNYDTHDCPGCGEPTDHNGKQSDGVIHNSTGRKCYE